MPVKGVKSTKKKPVISVEEIPISTPIPEPENQVITDVVVPVSTRKRKNTKKKEEPVPTDTNDHVIIQLPIQSDIIKTLIETDPLLNPLEYTPNIMDPEPYAPNNQFISTNDILETTIEMKDNYNEMIKKVAQETVETHDHTNCCYWCCHSIGAKDFGMPVKYDAYHKTFTTFGNFCSLECSAAYNFSNHNGSDRMWEIHSWIQMIAEKIGFKTPIRPAPSRYLLKMFNGSMEIEEFRNAHKSNLKTYIMNMPPMIHVQSHMEVLNTSYLGQKNNITTTDNNDKTKLYRKRAVVDIKKSLQSKMNLTITNINEETEST